MKYISTNIRSMQKCSSRDNEALFYMTGHKTYNKDQIEWPSFNKREQKGRI